MIDDIDDIHKLVDARVNVVSVKQSSKPSVRHKRFFVYVGGFAVSLVLGMSILAPIFNSKSGLDLFNDWLRGNVKPVDNTSLAGEVVTPEPYIYVPPSRMGAFGKYVVNVPFYRNWLNNTVSWKVEKSSDGAKWSDYKKFVVKKDWNEKELTEKHTIVVTADEEAYYRVLTNTKTDKQLVDYVDDSKNTSFSMRFKVSESKDYTLLYNWSDYSKSAEASKTVLTKSVKTDVLSSKQYFEWMVVSSSKLKKDEVFTVDPVYGTVGDAVTNSWEFDAQEGGVVNPSAIVKMGNSQYYLCSAIGDTGSDTDGYLRVLKVYDSNGTIHTAVIDKWQYDTDGYSAGIFHISGDVYAVIYGDATSTIGKIFTTTAYSNNGTLKKDVIDSINLAYYVYYSPYLIHVTGDIYVAGYQENGGGYDHQIETFQISNAGVITDAHCDIQEIDATSTGVVIGSGWATMIDSDTLAVVWQETASYDAWLRTYNISDAGLITNNAADSWEYDTGGTTSTDRMYNYIIKVSDNVFAIGFSDTDQDGWIKTVEINDDGNIVGNAFIDTLEFADAQTVAYLSMIVVNDASIMGDGNGVYGVTYKDAVADPRIYTVNITSAGIIPATYNDYLTYNTDCTNYPSVTYCSGNYYLAVMQGESADGYSKTFTIETYQAPAGGWTNVCPIAKGEHPSNSSTNVVLKPAVGCTITDSNSNHTMNVTFATNSSGTWRNFQTNRTVANNSKVNWTMSMAGTGNAGYSWRVYVHDGFCNASFTYKFKTVNNASAESWNIVSDTFNGAFTNTTVWHIKDSSINGVFTNTTSWKVKDSSINGKFTNTTAWKSVDTGVNGVFKNTSVWHDVDSAMNGVFTNSTAWKIVDNTINGVFTNITKWLDLDIGVNGVFTNASVWHDVDSAVNGAFTNTTIWKVQDSSINGMFTNTTIWKVLDSAVNGVFTNVTKWLDLDVSMNGVFTNSSVWHDLDTGINGKFTNSTVWKILDSAINGLFTNTSAWKVLDSAINGAFTNTSIWHVVDSAINGEFTNTSIPLTWKIVDDTVNGNFKNTSVWKEVSTGINGEFTNITVWKVMDSSINGEFTNNTKWLSLDVNKNGVFTNTSVWHVVNGTINGSFTNTSTGLHWQVVSGTINGRFINYTGNATGGASIRYGYSIGTVAGIMIMAGSCMVIIPLFMFRRRRRRDRY